MATEGTPASARRIVQDVTRAAAEVPIPTRARQAGSRAALGVV
ncbi:protein of unassigned function [Methylobacterium oryzae CBMB20]|uniref:Protein of unassigned function n=1 Tax=Methylobacterium oryzae CBMB20 TaxID=693986 RepID=A0A089NNF1_9HYPH|nr:protein of unassigned function [Methylobacterium oryzae CBMB20]